MKKIKRFKQFINDISKALSPIIGGNKYVLTAACEAMSPKITSGDILLMDRVKYEDIIWGEIYVIVDNVDQIIIRRVYAPANEADGLLLISNELDRFPGFVIPKDHIATILKVHSIFRRLNSTFISEKYWKVQPTNIKHSYKDAQRN